MPRTADIHAAFVAVIQLNPKGYRYLSTDSFIEAAGVQLALYPD